MAIRNKEQPPFPPSDDLSKAQSPAAPKPPSTEPVNPTPVVEKGPDAVGEKGTNDVSPARGPNPEPEPKILFLAKKELDEMIDKLQTTVDSLKSQKAESPDHFNLIKLSASKLLREVTVKTSEMQDTVKSMRALSDEIRTKQKNFDEAIENNRSRSQAFRTERAAFIKLRSMTEKEYYELVNEIMARTKAEKEAQ